MRVTGTDPYLWMNAAEATFLRAEYELRWGSAETAGTLYEQAVTLSFEERGADNVKGYLSDATSTPAAYKDPLNKHSMASPHGTPRRISKPTSNGSLPRNGLPFSRWEPRRGQNTAVRVIPVCCQLWWITAVAP